MKLWPFKKTKAATMKEPEWWKQAINVNPVSSGQVVTVDTALSVSTVWACVRIIAESIASLPIHVYERTTDGKVRSFNHPVERVLSVMPNGEQTPLELIEFMLSNVLLRGTAYSHRIRNGRGQVVSLEPLYTHHMHVMRNAAGDLVFDYQEPGNSKLLSASDIWRIAGLGSDGVTGYSPITLGRESIGVALAAEEQAGKLFSNGMQTPKVFEKDGTLSDEAFDRLKEQIANRSGSENAYKTLILEDGLTLKNIGLTAEDSQFLQSRKFQIADIARWYRVPLHMINELDKSSFNNIENQSIEFVMHTLRPWIKRIEHSISRDLFVPAERDRYFAEFKIDGLLRGDTETRYNAYGKGINDGWLSPNEVRAFENLNPVDGLDEYRTPLNMAIVGEDEPQEQVNDKEMKVILAERKKAKTEQDFINAMSDYYGRKGYEQWQKS